MRDFGRNRQLYQRQHIANYFDLSGTSNVSVNIENQNMGKVLINNVELIKQNKTGIYFKDIPIEIKAIPDAGYRFVKWVGITNEFQNPVSFVLSADTMTLTVQFEAVSVNIIPSVISVNLTLQKINSPFYSVGNIKVDSSITLTIESGVEI